MTSQIVFAEPVRTPIGTAFRGSLTETPPEELARIVLAEAVGRSQLDPAAFDDIVLAESNYGGGDLARHAAVEAGRVPSPRHLSPKSNGRSERAQTPTVGRLPRCIPRERCKPSARHGTAPIRPERGTPAQ